MALTILRIRDDAWARMDPGHRTAHGQLWTDLTRRACPGYVAAPASLLAFTAWQAGHGALANLAVDRALADQPDYSMALLLRDALTAGLPPSTARLPMTPEEVSASYDERDRRRLSEPTRTRAGQAGPRPSAVVRTDSRGCTADSAAHLRPARLRPGGGIRSGAAAGPGCGPVRSGSVSLAGAAGSATGLTAPLPRRSRRAFKIVSGRPGCARLETILPARRRPVALPAYYACVPSGAGTPLNPRTRDPPLRRP